MLEDIQTRALADTGPAQPMTAQTIWDYCKQLEHDRAFLLALAGTQREMLQVAEDTLSQQLDLIDQAKARDQAQSESLAAAQQREAAYQQNLGQAHARHDQMAHQLDALRTYVNGPPTQNAPDAWARVREILEQTEPVVPVLVQEMVAAMQSDRPPIEQAGRVRYLLVKAGWMK